MVNRLQCMQLSLQKPKCTFLADVSKFVVGRNWSQSPAVLVVTVRDGEVVLETLARHALSLESRDSHCRTNQLGVRNTRIPMASMGPREFPWELDSLS